MQKIYFKRPEKSTKRENGVYDGIESLIDEWGEQSEDILDSDFMLVDVGRADPKDLYMAGIAEGSGVEGLYFYKHGRENPVPSDSSITVMEYNTKKELVYGIRDGLRENTLEVLKGGIRASLSAYR